MSYKYFFILKNLDLAKEFQAVSPIYLSKDNLFFFFEDWRKN